jgi:hypothetical protein
MTEWEAVWSCGHEEFFTTDSFVYNLPTNDFIEAAKLVIAQIGSGNDLISLRKVI